PPGQPLPLRPLREADRRMQAVASGALNHEDPKAQDPSFPPCGGRTRRLGERSEPSRSWIGGSQTRILADMLSGWGQPSRASFGETPPRPNVTSGVFYASLRSTAIASAARHRSAATSSTSCASNE